MHSPLYTSSQTDLIKRIRGHLKLGVNREKDHAQCMHIDIYMWLYQCSKSQWEKKPIVSGCDEA